MTLRLICLLILAACAKQAQIPKACGTNLNANRCTGDLRVHAVHAATFVEAGQQAIDVVFSDRFSRDLDLFMKAHAQDPDLKEAWAGQTADQIVAALRTSVIGIRVKTRGGAGAWIKYKFYGTVATEGGPLGGPVEINWYSAKTMTAAQLANSIVHEAAHAIGLTHPHMGGPREKDWDIARCEPPYLIGSIAEQIAAADRPQPGSIHCTRLRR